MDVDLDRSVDNVTLVHEPETTGMNITWSDYLLNIIEEKGKEGDNELKKLPYLHSQIFHVTPFVVVTQKTNVRLLTELKDLSGLGVVFLPDTKLLKHEDDIVLYSFYLKDAQIQLVVLTLLDPSSPIQLILKVDQYFLFDLTAQPALRFNGGGHINHSIFWKNLSPKGGGAPSGSLANAINRDFGSFEEFKTQLSTATIAIQGSGWGWLSYNPVTKRLQIVTCQNQDPLEATTAYAPMDGCSDATKDAFYDALVGLLRETKHSDIVILAGGLSAQVGHFSSENKRLGDHVDDWTRMVSYCVLDGPVSEVEVALEFKLFKRNKAPGPYLLLPFLFKDGEEMLISELRKLLQTIWETEEVPRD
ncbi:superoxide dismutase, Fe-Mn family [Paragonimus westermani]|uniref:superoxide dismutase n=1 Tax=Paragonimus westermani TaxID=34504 RepID=A0A5J4NB41_9TREM|nr:superoxide dismutase, Fe-Mn family [Paragonimus westermani]